MSLQSGLLNTFLFLRALVTFQFLAPLSKALSHRTLSYGTAVRRWKNNIQQGPGFTPEYKSAQRSGVVSVSWRSSFGLCRVHRV